MTKEQHTHTQPQQASNILIASSSLLLNPHPCTLSFGFNSLVNSTTAHSPRHLVLSRTSVADNESNMSHHPDDDMGHCRHCLWICLPPQDAGTCAYQGQLSSRTRMVRIQSHPSTSPMSMPYGRSVFFPAPHVIPLVGCALPMRPANRPIKIQRFFCSTFGMGMVCTLSGPVNCCNPYLEKIRDLGPRFRFTFFLCSFGGQMEQSRCLCVPFPLSLSV